MFICVHFVCDFDFFIPKSVLETYVPMCLGQSDSTYLVTAESQKAELEKAGNLSVRFNVDIVCGMSFFKL